MASDLVGLYAKRLRDAFAPLIPRDRSAALVDFPDSANCGEHAIWLGQKRVLSELGIPIAYESSAQSYDRDTMAAKIGTGTILMQGGGNLGRPLLRHETRLRVLQDFPNNKIIFFPQQVTSRDNQYLERIADVIGRHPDVTLFARSTDTQRILAEHFPQNARIELAPDMSFLLGPLPRLSEPLYDIVWLARTDHEHANDRTEAAARLASQAAEKIVLPKFADGVEINLVVKQRPPTVLLTDWQSMVFENEEARLAYQRLDFDARSQARVSRATHILSLGRLVITDRLHAHIFCLMMGIPHVLIGNESGKNRNFYETWTRDSNLCRLARVPAEAWSMARTALKQANGGEWAWEGTPSAGGGAGQTSGTLE
ncbi:MAG TPA: polysaccharide pyruvyl transferase family protein [Micropepsaceae bacterium]|nr:polysaccharide pyruvyl transferase family protein [Micropepsaceae bacterium]